MQPGRAVQPEYFEIVDAGVYLGIVKPVPNDPDPKKTQYNQLQKVYRLVASGRIPVIRMGSRLYFSKTDLDVVMRAGVHQSCPTTSQPLSPQILRSLQQDE
jgi:excisionase family DNA binding protein